MIQMRWLRDPNGEDRRLQFRYRLGAINIVRAPAGAGIALGRDEGWSAWETVPEEIREEEPTNETA